MYKTGIIKLKDEVKLVYGGFYTKGEIETNSKPSFDIEQLDLAQGIKLIDVMEYSITRMNLLQEIEELIIKDIEIP